MARQRKPRPVDGTPAEPLVTLLNLTGDEGDPFFHVELDGVRIGFIRKYKNTKTTRHPWKAFGGTPTEFLGDFWPKEVVGITTDAKRAAVELVVDVRTKRKNVVGSPEVEAFIHAIRQAPTDETARLVFADWLDERDLPNDRDAAAWLRLDVAATPELMAGREGDLYRAGVWAPGSHRYFARRIGNHYYAAVEAQADAQEAETDAGQAAELGDVD